MLTPYDLHDYQARSVAHILNNPFSMLHIFMGGGKSIITLSAIDELFSQLKIRGVLVVAPKRVCQAVWRQEAKKWRHTNWLNFSLILGNEKARKRAVHDSKAHVWLTNYENMAWLVNYLEHFYLRKGISLPFDMIVYDEVSRLKNTRMRQGVESGRAILKLLPYLNYRVGLTGTPASNGLLDLFGQYLVTDSGARLGTSFDAYRARYFRRAGYSQFKWEVMPGFEQVIADVIGDITVSLKMEDYLKMPPIVVNDILLNLPPKHQTEYDRIEKEMIIELQSGKQVEVFNEASIINRTLQFANGAIFTEPGCPEWENIHDVKLKALDEIVEEAAGEPILLAFEFKHDAYKILKKYKDAVWFNSKMSETEAIKAISDFEQGRIRLLIGHPACLAGDTEVLTEKRGWIPITDVLMTDRVHDGIEFVQHDGCMFSGVKNTIDVFGIRMTENHKLLINHEWVEAKNVKTNKETRQNARLKVRKEDEHLFGRMYEMWESRRNIEAELQQTQQTESKVLPNMQRRSIPPFNQNKNMAGVERDEIPSNRPGRQKLPGSGNRNIRRLVSLLEFLQRYARRLSEWFDYRTYRQLQELQQRELQMGNEYGTAVEQTEQQIRDLQRRENPSSRVMQSNGNESWMDNSVPKQIRGPQCRYSCNKSMADTRRGKENVYDIVNCGPRHRFLIRNKRGEIFISHNSLGHGLDRLQKAGHIVVWYGLNWSLDLYDQTIARLWRQGQERPVIVHRILIDNSTDLVVKAALERKANDETSIKQAIMQYWQKKSGVIS